MTYVIVLGAVFILFIVASIFLAKFIKHVFLASLAIFGLLLILTAIFGYSIYKDAMQIKDDAPNKPTLFVLTNEDDEILTSFLLDPTQKDSLQEMIIPLDSDSNQNLEAVLNENPSNILEEVNSNTGIDQELFKIVDFDISVIENSPIETVDMQILNVSKDDVVEILESDDVYSTMVDVALASPEIKSQIIELVKIELESGTGMSLEELGLSDEDIDQIDINNIPKEEIIEQLKSGFLSDLAESPDELKSMIFLGFITKASADNPEEMVKYYFENYKDGSITVMPDSISFALLKMSPKAIISEAINIAKSNIPQGIDANNESSSMASTA